MDPPAERTVPLPHDSDRSLRRTSSGPSLAQSYRPSTLVLFTVILLTLGSTFTEVFIPVLCIFYSITTYGPTLHFVVTGIVQNLRGISPNDSDVLKASRRARILACIWIVAMSLHVWCYWSARAEGFAGIFLVPTLSGIPATILLVCIATRCTLDVRWVQKEGRLRLRRDEEQHNIEPTISPFQPRETVDLSPAPSQSMTHTALIYQPGLSVLCLSILLTAVKITFQLTYNTADNIGPQVFILFIALVYAPTIISHLYFIWRFRYGPEQTFENGLKFGSWLFDLLSLWMIPQYTELMVLYYGKDKVSGISKSSINFAEILVVGYMAMRYSRSVRREWKWMSENIAVETTMIPGDDQSLLIPVAGVSSETDLDCYQPSIITITTYAGLSIACMVIETSAELVCGGPMTIFVYVPTTYLCISILVKRFRSSHKDEKAPERWQQLCALWVLTQAFYLFVWPISQYLEAHVMQPWVRWPAVAISVYIAGRYMWDEHLKKERGIRLPPDSDVEASVSGVERAEEVHAEAQP